MKRLRSALKAESGSSLVEYAIVFALLLTMLLGIAEFSRALYAYHFVSSTAREAARFAAVRGSTCASDSSCTAPATTDDIQTFAQHAPLGIDGSQVTATTTWPVQVSSPTICSTPATQNSPGCSVQVTVSYTFNFLFPFVPSSSIAMSSTSQMVISH